VDRCREQALKCDSHQSQPWRPVATQLDVIAEVFESMFLQIVNQRGDHVVGSKGSNCNEISLDPELFVRKVEPRVDVGAKQSLLLERFSLYEDGRKCR